MVAAELSSHPNEEGYSGLQQMVERSYYDTTRDQRSTIPSLVEKFVGRKALGL